MGYLIGAAVALAVFTFAWLIGFDRDRAFYPTLLIVIASYYILFAAMGHSAHALLIESLAAVGFLVVAVVGFKTNPWLVAVALAGHGVFDFFHHRFIQNPGVPMWWPEFCLAFECGRRWVLGGADHEAIELSRQRTFVRPILIVDSAFSAFDALRILRIL